MPPFLGIDALPDIPHHPDPFVNMDGSRVDPSAGALSNGWRCRREEISQQLQHYELGVKPPKPASVTGSVSEDEVVVHVSTGGSGSLNFTAKVSLPRGGRAPYPVLIGMGLGFGGRVSAGSLSTPRIHDLGVAVIGFDNNDIALQNDGTSRGACNSDGESSLH